MTDSPYGDESPPLLRSACPAGGVVVIRNVVVGRLRQTEDPAQQAADAALLQEGLAGIATLKFPGMIAMNIGIDLARVQFQVEP